MASVSKNILLGWDILVVDDDPDSLEVAQTILKHYGATVHIAINGEQALKVLQHVKPRFIISDLSMPVMDGWGFIAALQQDRELSEIPIIALTAHAVQGDRARAISSGFHNYITKPFTVKTFIADLMNILFDIPQFKLQISVVNS